MAKAKSQFVCSECGAIYPQWMGRCFECNQWNTLEEQISEKTPNRLAKQGWQDSENLNLLRLQDIQYSEEDRLDTGIQELNRTLGGGVVPGSLMLLGGEPGIGKSTVLLQAAYAMAELQKQNVIYVSGEESAQQIKSRAQRLGFNESENFKLLAESEIQKIVQILEKEQPAMVILDSIQAVFDARLEATPGSVSQVKNTCNMMLKLAKGQGISVWIIGHVNKDGDIAGPKVLEHMVDTVLYFEGERYRSFRLLRTIKNRFGATHEVGVFDMTASGLKEVTNPSALFLAEYSADNSGTAIVATMEGTRPILVEIQALVYSSYANFPKRSGNGIAYQRLIQLIAVLEKRVGLNLSKSDVLVNVVSGLSIEEPAADLGIAMALISSLRNLVLDQGTLFIGEVGLGGEIRAVSQLERRLKEGLKLGFKRAIIPASSLPLQEEFVGIEIIPVRKILEALKHLPQAEKNEKQPP